MQWTLEQYTKSCYYQQDLVATCTLWGAPEVLGIAGMFIFLSYITVPKLTSVQPIYGSPRMYTMAIGLKNGREKQFLLRALGLSTESSWEGGIRNVCVRAMMSKSHQNHLRFSGMSQQYIDYFAGIIALSVLRVYAAYSIIIDGDIKAGYWRYMQYMLSLLGVYLKEEAETHSTCQEFLDKHTQATMQGRILFNVLQETYSEYIEKSLPVLFPKTMTTVQTLLEGRDLYDA